VPTPMFEQFHALKAQHPDAVLFFRMGDFYETFYDDAVIAHRVLDVTLTSRNKNDPEPIPMAGVPWHAASGYVRRLVEAGHRVAIAEQVGPIPKKGLVTREIVRVVSPGVVLDPSSLDARSSNYLVGVCRDAGERYGVSLLDVSTGDYRQTTVRHLDGVLAELHRFEPSEALLEPSLADHPELLDGLRRSGARVSPVSDEVWGKKAARQAVADLLQVGYRAAPGGTAGARAAGALAAYAMENMRGAIGNVHELQTWTPSGYMVLDDTTRRNLELTKTLMGGHRKGSLLHLLDRTATAMGARRLKEWLGFPLLDPEHIAARQRAVQGLMEDPPTAEDLARRLHEVADVERINARVAQGSANARDLRLLLRSLTAVPEVVELASRVAGLQEHLPSDLLQDLQAELEHWLAEDPPASLTEGGLIARGAHAELDDVLTMALEGRSIMAQMEADERASTGISSLKIKHNKVFGYFLEVSRSNLHKVPDRYLRKQTLSNAERYITPELKELEDKVLGADERRKALEYELFVALRERVGEQGARLAHLARQLASVDVFRALADVAGRQRWVRPTVDLSTDLDIEGGRHPVVESLMTSESFVPNDVSLIDQRMIVITGPNMSGKSTIMRQTALITLLAQIGSFVPATRARLGIADRIFTRVGASDDLASGQSTFMVEMSETANILRNASARSLVILDEIGRGTSTYDGLSIAWAVAEDLVDRVGARALFATHYHELCELAETRPAVRNQSVAVSEWDGEILFLRTLREGGASRSYGIQCARLAGIPDLVIGRASDLLTHFEKHAPRDDRNQLSLFGTFSAPAPAAAPEVRVETHPVVDALAAVDPDDLTPRAALQELYRLRALLDG